MTIQVVDYLRANTIFLFSALIRFIFSKCLLLFCLDIIDLK